MVRAFLIGSLFLTVSCFGQTYGHSGGGHYASGGQNRGPVAGNRFGYGYGQRAYGRGYRGTGVFAYPVYVGGYGGYYGDPGDYGSGYAPGYAPGYGGDPAMQQGPPPAPPVVINQYFGAPPMGPAPDPQDDQNIHMYQQQSAPAGYSPQPPSDSRTYLIAYKDHSVYTALAYWIEGNTLHYVTTANTHNQADLNLIDVDFTKKLNADRSMPFNVPNQ
jgi:hypothetical protein